MYFNFCFCFYVGILIGITSFTKGLKICAIDAGILIGITSFTKGLKICAIAAGIKKYKSIIKKNKKKHDKTLLAKTKWNSIKSLNFYGFNRLKY